MRYILVLGYVFILITSWAGFHSEKLLPPIYDSKYVDVSTVKFKEDQFHVIYLKRDSNRVKAKYFAASDYNGNNVFQRYKKWSAGKNIILVSSGTYMDYDGVPVGLTIDNGVMVNKNLAKIFDALVVVYANGGITVTNLKDGDLKLKGNGADTAKKYDLRKSAWDLQAFTKWSESHEATVFQTHLLVYKNKLTISFMNANPAVNPRRFLAIGKDRNGKGVHAIIQSTAYTTLYDGAKRTLDFLNQMKGMEVVSMINLDTGDQDVFKFFEKDGTVNKTIKGARELDAAVNLLTYYFQ